MTEVDNKEDNKVDNIEDNKEDYLSKCEIIAFGIKK